MPSTCIGGCISKLSVGQNHLYICKSISNIASITKYLNEYPCKSKGINLKPVLFLSKDAKVAIVCIKTYIRSMVMHNDDYVLLVPFSPSICMGSECDEVYRSFMWLETLSSIMVFEAI